MSGSEEEAVVISYLSGEGEEKEIKKTKIQIMGHHIILICNKRLKFRKFHSLFPS